jgi:two-component sensor histidine kinase
MFPVTDHASMTTGNAVTLVHLAGFITGIVLYAMLGAMAWRAHAADRRAQRDDLLILVAVLGLVWNAGALVMIGSADLGLGSAPQWLTAVAFAALGFLPAAVIQMAVAPTSNWRPVVAAGYALSAVASVLHVVAALGGTAPSPAALWLLSLGFPGVLIWLIIAGDARAAGGRAIAAAALAAFATTALHLSRHSANVDESFILAVLGHQGSLPLVLTILYQDYRFALVDLFLKRAVSLLLLVAIAALGYLALVAPALADPNADPLRMPLLVLGLWVGTALAFPLLRAGVRGFVDRALLHRPDYRKVRAAVANRIRDAETPAAVADVMCSELRSALSLEHAEWTEDPSRPALREEIVAVSRDGRASAIVHLPVTEAPGLSIRLGGLPGGRRLLSDDVALLEWLAIAAARRIDEIRIVQERLEQTLRRVELTRLATHAELQALRARLNPHFLFNALTTIGQLLRESPDRALATLYQLTGLLRAVLRSPTADLVPLAEELEIVTAYLGIEKARFETRLEVEQDVAEELLMTLIPPLLLQPLVENAVKHGIGPQRGGGTVRVVARRIDLDIGAMLELEVSDTGVGGDAEAMIDAGADRFGLLSVKRRLDRHFGTTASFDVVARRGEGTTVRVRIPFTRGGSSSPLPDESGHSVIGASAT